MPTSSWTRSNRKIRFGSVTAVCAVSAGALLGLTGTATATPTRSELGTPPPQSSTPQPDARGTTATEAAPKPVKPLGDSVVEAAAQQSGKPYSYGATGPDSFDCSGLTQFVHRQLGIELPRTSRAQKTAVSAVDKASMRPGDLVFFANSGGKVYHVGIFAGNGQMWAAPETGDVVRLQKIWTDSYTAGRAW